MSTSQVKRATNSWRTILILLMLSSAAQAHFVFVKSVPSKKDAEREAVVYFSEAAHMDGERLPDKIKSTKLWLRTAQSEKPSELKIEEEDRDGWIAMFEELGKLKAFSLEAHCDYGIHHGTMLRYRAKHVRFSDRAELPSIGVAKEFELDVVPNLKGTSLTFTTLWKGKPIADIEVAVEYATGKLEELTTDAKGTVTIDAAQRGFYSARANHESGATGKHEGEDYDGASYYTTLTLHTGDDSHSATKKSKKTAFHETSDANGSLLPEAVSSFGGVVCDDHLYVYSGHTGNTHAHSKHNLSQHFRRIALKPNAKWEELPSGTPLQGLPLVEYNRAVYRVGGLQALNDDVDSPNLHSTNEFACFDPATKKWTRLTDLPEARSSHDAVVMGSTLYVVGGWNLMGDEDGEWHEHALSADLSKPTIEWKRIPVPFARRALAASHADGKLYAIGGMNEDHDIERTVSVYDPSTNKWQAGPELPGKGMNGFGVSAWNLNGRVLVSGTDDRVFRLAEDGTAWTTAQKLATPRFFHQLVPAPDGGLLAVGGASMKKGHLRDIEVIEFAAKVQQVKTSQLQTTEQK